MIQKTKDYGIFKFRKDNREKISPDHVNRIAESIKSKNLLEFRPITINKNFEVLDGQNRLLAAQKLDVEIYYNITEDFDPKDIILLNTAKSWGIADYLNFYVQNGAEEYIKLNNFIIKNQLQLKIAVRIAFGSTNTNFKSFKDGKFVFKHELIGTELENCKFTIQLITKKKGLNHWTSSSRFWQPLIKIICHPDFDLEKWVKNLNLLMEKIGPRATEKGYLISFQEIYNFRNPHKISLMDTYEG